MKHLSDRSSFYIYVWIAIEQLCTVSKHLLWQVVTKCVVGYNFKQRFICANISEHPGILLSSPISSLLQGQGRKGGWVRSQSNAMANANQGGPNAIFVPLYWTPINRMIMYLLGYFETSVDQSSMWRLNSMDRFCHLSASKIPAEHSFSTESRVII